MFLLIPVFAAAVFPPTIAKSFSPTTIGINETSTMTITIANPNTSDLTGAAMNDHFPPQFVSVGSATTTCPGSSVSLTSPPIILFFSGTIPANGTCTITVLVSCATPGVYQNLTGSVFSTGPPSLGGASATLTVLSNIPALSPAALLLLALALGGAGLLTSSSSS